ncbi:MAG: hypothetical protein MUP21_14355 [Dehalococcoidia bacterium]|nr:hypothetical protein [Dehalococcoidia bacterium]
MDEEKKGPDRVLEAEATVLFYSLKSICRVQPCAEMPEATGSIGGWFVTFKRQLIPGGLQAVLGFSRLDRRDIEPHTFIPAEFVVAWLQVFGETDPRSTGMVNFPGRGQTLLIAFPVEVLGPHAVL